MAFGLAVAEMAFHSFRYRHLLSAPSRAAREASGPAFLRHVVELSWLDLRDGLM